MMWFKVAVIGLIYLFKIEAKFEDCEKPPEVEFSTVLVSYDEKEEFVTAAYRCQNGYRLEGKSEITCDLDTDEWLQNPPKCQPDGENAEEKTPRDNKKRQRNKVHEIKEEHNLDHEFSRNLDLSCMSKGLVKAPSIDNGYIAKYNRRRKGEKIFLVAFYECNEDFEMENVDQDRLYCSKEQWVAVDFDENNTPKCVAVNEDDNEDEEEDYSDAGENASDGESEVETEKTPVKHEETESTSRHTPTPVPCDTDYGCDQECSMVKYDYDENPVIQCKCFKGFYLDEYDGRRCHDIDECSEENFGCEQICHNLNGSAECRCHAGLAVDRENPKKCVDVDECLENPEICGTAPCENSYGSYNCLEESTTESTTEFRTTMALTTESTTTESTTTEANNDFRHEERVEDKDENITMGNHENSSFEGDANEESLDEEEEEEEENVVENVLDNDETSTIKHTVQENVFPNENAISSTTISNKENVHDETDEDDIDEEEGGEDKDDYEIHTPTTTTTTTTSERTTTTTTTTTAPSHEILERKESSNIVPDCQDVDGELECTCIDGYELSDDGSFCQDIDECEAYSNDDEDSEESQQYSFCSYKCTNTIGSYICSCPETQRLGEDRRSCIPIYCDELEVKCSHECVDKDEGFSCMCPRGFSLKSDLKTCKMEDDEKEEEEEEYFDTTVNTNYVETHEPHKTHFKTTEITVESVSKVDRCSQLRCSHFCEENDGEHFCRCPEGLKLSDDEENCNDIDECSQDENICGHMECENTYGSFKCVEEERKNLCENNGGCSHVCRVYNNEVLCECPENMDISDDGKNCMEYDPCLNSVDDKSCRNIVECEHGFIYNSDSESCEDINECLEVDKCQGGVCENTEGSFRCICHPGYVLSHNHSCVDIDECLENNGNCSHKCINYPSTYACSCPFGQILLEDDHTCGFTDLCEPNNGGCAQICDYDEAKVLCSCNKGYALSSNGRDCDDINECDDQNGGCQQICINSEGSFHCNCYEGFELDKNNLSCIDVDECVENNGNCSNICLNLHGGKICKCESGFFLSSDNHTCHDIDECKDLHDCSQICINTEGSYECGCNPGYQLSHDKFNCHDVDECRDSPCSHSCVNTQGSFVCECQPGYVLDESELNCVDLDECAVDNDCSQICVNTEGSYHCSCREGEILSSDGKSCELINLCSLNNGGCEHLCHHNQSGVHCVCREGYEPDSNDLKRCLDVDECKTSHNCQQKCVNLPGSYSCECYPGYTFNDIQNCVDINECNLGTFDCPAQSKCINTVGSHECMCNEGFKLSRDRNECIEIKNSCGTLSVEHGQVRCSRSRHKTQLFYRTKCTVTCDKGYKLHGPPTRHCNGTGHWDNEETKCVALSCPKIINPKVGTILPASCTTGQTFPGERCFLHCPSGYKAAGKRVAVCSLSNLDWHPTGDLHCVAVKSMPVKHVAIPQRKLPEVKKHTTTTPPPNPYIKCPTDIEIIKPQHDKSVLVSLARPDTNVDWIHNVDAFPEAAKQLKIYLPIGSNVITFRARSSFNALFDICRVVVNVVERLPPTVTFCPESFNVELKPYENSRSVFWHEPRFESKQPLRHILKSHAVGTHFGPGPHFISYVATDDNGLTAKCTFEIMVQAREARVNTQYFDTTPIKPHTGLKNHDSFLICPGKRAVRIHKDQAWHLPRGCVIKNVKTNNMNRRVNHDDRVLKRPTVVSDNSIHHATRHHKQNTRLQYYSSWDTAKQQQQQQRNLVQDSFPVAHWN